MDLETFRAKIEEEYFKKEQNELRRIFKKNENFTLKKGTDLYDERKKIFAARNVPGKSLAYLVECEKHIGDYIAFDRKHSHHFDIAYPDNGLFVFKDFEKPSEIILRCGLPHQVVAAAKCMGTDIIAFAKRMAELGQEDKIQEVFDYRIKKEVELLDVGIYNNWQALDFAKNDTYFKINKVVDEVIASRSASGKTEK